ncbi:hypothetical protein [Nostoc sp. NMS4]|uniref:hypothetical protein n=1 Tax=Nostoc sp. NMS4 TaxID=2815390 RepID=UPI0025D10DA3|nr:hypothetical protein [Nostoc sp. NMS4]MBN3925113.1 hypothetical protein [Nostoc sp. NMS4]
MHQDEDAIPEVGKLDELEIFIKMTFLSTGRIHVLRVQPEMDSARIAICWVNWDIECGKFFCVNLTSKW